MTYDPEAASRLAGASDPVARSIVNSGYQRPPTPARHVPQPTNTPDKLAAAIQQLRKSSEPAYTYKAWPTPSARDPLGVVDGDTMNVCVELGFDVTIATTLRLYGINAPELSTPEGKVAKLWSIAWYKQHCPGGTFLVQTYKDKTEKYGRYLATVIAPDGANYNNDIVAAGHAVPYNPELPAPNR